MKELRNTIKEVLPELVDTWNNEKLPLLETVWEQSFKDYFSKRQTQEKTKMVAPVLDVIFSRLMKEKLSGFVVDEGKGRDYDFNGTKIECKITLSVSDSWTGNGYPKTPWHIFFKFEMNEHGKIISSFSTLVNMSKCKSAWSTTGSSANFSSLKFLVEDLEHLDIISGEYKLKKKYINPTLEAYGQRTLW